MPSDKEINRVLNWAYNREDQGERKDGSYEQGVIAALEWMIGDRDDAPDAE